MSQSHFHCPSPSALSGLILFVLTCLLIINHAQVAADGMFQLELVRMTNPLSQLATGQCCETTPTPTTTTTTTATSGPSSQVCPGAPGGCRTALHVCLKEFQNTPRPTGRCSFGEYTTGILGGSSFSSEGSESGTALINIPFNFTWSGLFTLVVKVVHRHQNGSEQLIVQDVKQSALNPDPEWHNISFGGSTTQGMYRIRIRCAPNYYNTTCTKLCKPRSDDFGHYTCDENGDKVCSPGWMGKPNCEKPICKTGCDKVNGYCTRPGECRCRVGSGWEGPLCDKCQPAPGCVHGTCKTPYECTCELNWGGVLCNLDLNYCGRHKPCLNGGECRSNQPNVYRCECVPGWTGKHCERRALSCSADPCLHGGTCQAHNNKDYTCVCPPGWTGHNCEQNVNECSSNPCRNGGTCIDGEDGFVCRCTARWQGPFCQLDADECQGRPCVNADACSNLVGDYVCTCQRGWTGKNCDININDCQDQCLHGSTCVDLVDGYLCACPLGYTGTRCEVDTDECASDPCLNGGQCQDLQGAYRCVCPPGYSGGSCQTDTDMCAPNPCQNGASCFDMQNGDYYCHCVGSYEGRNCQLRKDVDTKHLSSVIDSCTVEDLTGAGRSRGPPKRVSSNVCGAHGECINDLHSHGAFSCRCVPGYTGKYCHLNINDCASQPCKNQGTCVDGINTLQCICQPGWEGPLCDINVDDCSSAPCRNGGACVDLVNDFLCECEAGWKGRRCTLRSGYCDSTTCANGGTCHDMGDAFSCVCRQGWTGRTCQTRERQSCDSSPCQHGATCINSGDSFSCRCPDGYEGATCQINTNDCNPYPCYNGGKCIDGVNWYECNCTRGFTGPDCRININECESDPCTFGSTCIDGIGEYTCICPPGRQGQHCQTVAGDLLPKPQPCLYLNRVFAHQSTWEHDCNSCTCVNGHTTCSKVWCGPQNCLKHPNTTTDPVVTCGKDERCSVQTDVVCLTPPCLPWGRCRKRGRDVTGTTRTGDVIPTTTCRPGTSNYGYTCVKMTLVFDLERVPIGVSVEALCREIRGFQSLRPLASGHSVNVLCRLQPNTPNTIEIAVSVSGFRVDVERKSSASVHPTLRRVVDAIALSISRRRLNNTALSAVVEVKEEITIVTEQNTLVYVIPLVCSIMVFLGLLLIMCLVLWHYRHLPSSTRAARHSDYRHPTCAQNCKSNNENEENLRRYRNSIYEKGGGSYSSSRNSSITDQKSPDTELLEFDLEKYEKSPQHSGGSSKQTLERRNDSKQNISPLKTIKLKNINIELQREREGTV